MDSGHEIKLLLDKIKKTIHNKHMKANVFTTDWAFMRDVETLIKHLEDSEEDEDRQDSTDGEN